MMHSTKWRRWRKKQDTSGRRYMCRWTVMWVTKRNDSPKLELFFRCSWSVLIDSSRISRFGVFMCINFRMFRSISRAVNRLRSHWWCCGFLLPVRSKAYNVREDGFSPVIPLPFWLLIDLVNSDYAQTTCIMCDSICSNWFNDSIWFSLIHFDWFRRFDLLLWHIRMFSTKSIVSLQCVPCRNVFFA